MKNQITFCSVLMMSVFSIAACKNESKKTVKKEDTASFDKPAIAGAAETASSDTGKVAYDITKIPVTSKEIGTFPYLKAPEEYKFNDISRSDLKTVHFAIEGKLVPLEGKTYSSNIYKVQESESPFNLQTVQRTYDKVITDLGGVQVSTMLLPDQIEKIGKKRLEDEGDHAYTIIGANDYTLNHVNTYVIRTTKAEVWIELSFYQNGGYIYILEK